MSNPLTKAIKSIIPRTLKTTWRKRKESRELTEWERAGRPVPPPHIVKQTAVLDFARRFGYATLVETGTFLGDMVEAQRENFSRIYSIELSQELFERAVHRFRHDAGVTIIQGDSGVVLKTLVKELTSPALFWLDGHYSGGITARGEKYSPVEAEVETLLGGNSGLDHVLLIDDARLFVGSDDYPTLEQLRATVKTLAPNYRMEVENDIIRVFPHR